MKTFDFETGLKITTLISDIESVKAAKRAARKMTAKEFRKAKEEDILPLLSERKMLAADHLGRVTKNAFINDCDVMIYNLKNDIEVVKNESKEVVIEINTPASNDGDVLEMFLNGI